MSIVVYSIAKNESQFVERYLESCKDADHIIVGVCHDSTDNTKELLKNAGVDVIDINIIPWRFDAARNTVLSHVPKDADICIALDLDEVLLPGWREELEKLWTPETTICRYKYIFNWEDEAMTIPRLTLNGFKIHARDAYEWRYPIHECLEPLKPEVEVFTDKVQINHYPDLHKERPYQKMLDYAVLDDPTCQRMSHLRGRELFMHGRYEEAIFELKRHLNITKPFVESFPGESQTRALSWRLIARSIVALNGNPNDVIDCMLRAVAEFPMMRESWVWLADAWMLVGNYPSAYACAINAMNLNDRNMSIECEEICWGDYPAQLADKAFRLMIENQMIA